MDGLRALAVISVILYHFNPSLLPGGFIGVDIFFVISGFVVTGAAMRAETANLWRDLFQFWRRRWLRIVPPLLVCVFLCIALLAVLFAPIPRETYVGAVRTGLAASVGLGNLYLYRIALDYFQADQSINLFSHTWSLGVEEQFYLGFSAVILVAARLVFDRRRRTARLLTLTLIGATSFLLFLYRAAADPMADYYFLTSRLWELAAGSIISLSVHQLALVMRPWLTNAVQLCAVSGIAGAAFYSTPAGLFPVVPIVVGVLCAGAIISTGSNRGIVTRTLQLKPIVFIGLISYSLYLWHWPVILVFRYTVGLRSLLTVIAAVVTIVALSYSSYRFVEQRTRRRTEAFVTRLLPAFAVAFAILAATALVVLARPGIAYTGTRYRWGQDWLPPINFNYAAGGRINAAHCLLHHGGAVPSSIPLECNAPGIGGAPARRVLVLGDSHGFAAWPMVAYGADRGAFHIATMVHDGCSANAPESDMSPSCRAYWAQIPTYITANVMPGDVVLLSFLWYYFPAADFSNSFNRIEAVAKLVEDRRGILAVEAPMPHFDRPAFMCTSEWYRTDYDGCSIDRAVFEGDRRSALAQLQALVATRRAIAIWDPATYVCAPSCQQVRGSEVVFRDATHLSYTASRSLGPMFIDFVRALR